MRIDAGSVGGNMIQDMGRLNEGDSDSLLQPKEAPEKKVAVKTEPCPWLDECRTKVSVLKTSYSSDSLRVLCELRVHICIYPRHM